MIFLFHRYFPETEKTPFFLLLKNHLLYPNLTTRCQKVEKTHLLEAFSSFKDRNECTKTCGKANMCKKTYNIFG